MPNSATTFIFLSLIPVPRRHSSSRISPSWRAKLSVETLIVSEIIEMSFGTVAEARDLCLKSMKHGGKGVYMKPDREFCFAWSRHQS